MKTVSVESGVHKRLFRHMPERERPAWRIRKPEYAGGAAYCWK